MDKFIVRDISGSLGQLWEAMSSADGAMSDPAWVEPLQEENERTLSIELVGLIISGIALFTPYVIHYLEKKDKRQAGRIKDEGYMITIERTGPDGNSKTTALRAKSVKELVNLMEQFGEGLELLR